MFTKSVLILALSCTFALHASEGESEKEIRRVLNQWPQDFNAKNSKAVCGLFAPDLVASYPGTKDRTYTDMCEQLTHVMNQSDKKYEYQAPEIEQIIVEHDLAAVRLIWTLKITNGDQEEVVREKGLDVLKCQKDGSWKIAISYAYPLS